MTSPSETIAKAMEGVTPGLWYACEFKRPNAYHVRSELRHWSIASAMETEGCSTPSKDVPDAEARANAAYIAACNPVAMREVLDELYALRETALQLEAMKREMAELRRALEMISAESKESNEPTGRSVFKALATCGEIADVALRARTLIQGEKK